MTIATVVFAAIATGVTYWVIGTRLQPGDEHALAGW
jgi:hypothetical protein